MSIYTIDQVIEGIDQIEDINDLKRVTKEMIYYPSLLKDNGKLLRIISGDRYRDYNQIKCRVSPDKCLPYDTLKRLQESEIMGFGQAIIEAALTPENSYQTRDLLMLAALKVPKAYYMLPNAAGIVQQAKIEAAYILTLAGFEKKSKYIRETRAPIKVWRLRRGLKRLSSDTLWVEAHSTLKILIENTEKDRAINSLVSII